MAHHDHSDTVSEPPLSPFSNRSLLSDGTQTSDEPADLGAFTSVFRVMHQLQAQQQPIPVRSSPIRPESRTTTRSDSEYESDDEEASVAWSHTLIDSYMDHHSVHSGSNPSSPRIHSHEEHEDEEGSESSDTEGMYEDGMNEDGQNGLAPSLGDLDSALGFLAAEQAKLTASQDVRSIGHSSTGDSAWRHVVEPRRKRRRKRKGGSGHSPNIEEGKLLSVTVVPTPETSSSSLESSSSPGKLRVSPPAREPILVSTKAHRAKPRQLSHSRPTQQNLYIASSSSSPPHTTIVHSLLNTIDPRLSRLRGLTLKVQHQYPQNAFQLKQVLRHDFPSNNIVDPRGPEPVRGDPLTHVFIDHSNILVGFINHLKRTRKAGSGKPLLYFPALTLILERGRPISRRVLATSSPLYQNMDNAKELGYEVHVYVRVPEQPPDATSGTDNNASTNDTSSTNGPSALGLKNMKPRKPANAPILHTNTPPSVPVSGRPSIESDPGHNSMTTPRVINNNTRSQGHARSISIPTAANMSSSPPLPSAASVGGSASNGRIRYREQGVDELLQLKLHQALLSSDADPLPLGATIVLATGDGASGQFNEDGFVGAIRTALNKGWRVELYGWASGISNLWWKVKEEEGRDGKLTISTIDSFAGDLLEA
ncbi:hypothetical protein BU17DRAFT_98851 [Hysterangium stoloniferum]|nr:hypothetical protein BU17DRAFT_98851 [Hysterangium stoloniferum]